MKHFRPYLTFLLCAFPLCAISQQVAQHKPVTDSIWAKDVKSVFLNRNGVDLEAPVLRMGSSDRLLLRFDQLGDQPEDYRYRISHCNADWIPDTLEPYEYINGFEEENITEYQFSFTTLQYYVNYRQYLPAQYAEFIASGNYLLTVYRQDEPDSIILTRRFYVFEDILNIDVSIGRPTAATGNINRDQEVDVALSVKEGTYLNTSPQYLRVKVQQNQRKDLVRNIRFSGFSGSSLLYRWQDENVFPGGNCFRYFDLSNIRTPMYNIQEVDEYGGELYAFLKPCEDRSRANFSPINSLNGGMKINIFDRNNPQLEADYVWVNFSLPMATPFLDGNIYITGQFTDWLFNEDSRMEWQPQYKAYTKRIRLKQGYYSYQLVFLPIGAKEGLTSRLEGDHNATANDYTVYTYYRMPNDRFDRLVGIKQVKGNF